MRMRWSVVLGLLLVLMGCGGGGGGGSAGVGAGQVAAPQASLVTGVAATGAPIAGVVTLRDASAASATLTAATASDGSYSFDVSALTPPFLLRVSYSDTGGAKALYSLATGAGTANVTPLTTLALVDAAGGADPALLFAVGRTNDMQAAGARMLASVSALQSALAPLMQRYGVQGNLLTTPFTANHTGVDALLDAIAVTVTGTTLSIADKVSGSLVFSAPSNNIAAGSYLATGTPPPAQPAASALGIALYAAKCAGCHGDLAHSTVAGRATVGAIEGAIASNLGGMGALSAIAASDIQAISDAVLGTAATATPTPAVPATGGQADGATLYAASCAACHGALASSSKQGATAVRIQNAISGNVGGMGRLSTLSVADIQAIVTALSASPTSTPTSPGTPPQATGADGTTLYGTYCASCHRPLATSTKQGISIARLQSAIAANVGGMGALSTLTVTEVQAIVTALTPTTPTPTAVCGSCHAIPPATGHHSTHRSRSCSTCHGAGYSVTAVTAATHNDGVKNIVTTIGWNAASRSCSNSCHGRETW